MKRIPKNIEQTELEPLASQYLAAGRALAAPILTDEIYGLQADEKNRLLLMTKGEKPLSSLDILKDLDKRDLRGKNKIISKHNAGTAARLGSLALLDIHIRAEQKQISLSNYVLEALSGYARGLRGNMIGAMRRLEKPVQYTDAMKAIRQILYETKPAEGEDTPYIRLNR